MQGDQIQVLELRRLLHELRDQRPDICVRFRLLGELWQESFASVVQVAEEGVILLNAANNQAIIIKDLREVVQFEMDARYQNYRPHYHYTVHQQINITERHASSGS